MKKTLALALIVILIILIVIFFRSCQSEDPLEAETIFPPHKKGEMIVIYKNPPTPETKQRIKDKIDGHIDISSLNTRQCSDCDNYVELWQAEDINSLIHNEGIVGGSGSTKPIGEDDDAIYSVNFVSETPMEFSPVNKEYMGRHAQDSALLIREIPSFGKSPIVIAVLDTGIDTLNFNNTPYLWKATDDTSCYPGAVNGWNFTNNSANAFDGNEGKHGTLVSHYIINEFSKSPGNFVQIMSLKTHDDSGKGDLFANICAIHYAIKNNAKIINASWGFYNFQNTIHPYMDHLITSKLKEKGILFIAAAGNKVDHADSITRIVYEQETGTSLSDDSIRSLSINKFYPASLSKDESNNVISVTTVYEANTSPTQNFSSRHVDLGVKADTATATYMEFKLPFVANTDYTRGSSFAAAITSGKIGAYLPVAEYQANINKQDVINTLSTVHSALGISQFLYENTGLRNIKLVREGKYIIR